MKKLIKQAFIISSAILCMAITSCKKETGPQGPPGDAGVPGANGNANVTQISFGSKTISSAGLITLTLTGVDKTTAEKSLILTFAKGSNLLWYPIPGFGVGGSNEYRTFLNATDPASILTISTNNAGSAETFPAFRVIVIPANNLVNGRNGNPPYDISNYESVRAYFNLPE